MIRKPLDMEFPKLDYSLEGLISKALSTATYEHSGDPCEIIKNRLITFIYDRLEEKGVPMAVIYKL